MLRHATIQPERAWSTWSGRPAEMVFLPLGVRLTPVAYAGSRNAATLFPPGEGLRLGRHDLSATSIDLDLTHAGTTLAWSYAKPDPFRVVGRWRATTLGEWGLRFWVNLCVSAEGGEEAVHDAEAGALVIKVGTRFVALVGAEPAVQVTGHASVEGLAADYEAHGYFHLGSRAERAAVLALRYNLEMTREGAFALAVADRRDLAIAHARDALETVPDPAAPGHTGRYAGALDALRDVMAWNTVWDGINGRAYTSISRNWNQQKFGGFGVWLDDQLYAALMAGIFDPEAGRDNLRAALASATPQGNFACLVTANDAWVDRTQLPVASFVVWSMFLRTRDRSILTLMAAALRRNYAWWWTNRDPGGRGLVSYGTSDVGEGLYKGTSFGARNESSMDNAPIHDEARYDPGTRTLDCLDVGLNSLLALDAEMLSLISAELGDDAGARDFAERAEATRDLIRTELWDPSRRIFANRLWSGAFVRSLGPTSFYPFAAGVPTGEQTEHLLAHLADPNTFGGDPGLPGVTRDDPAFPDNSYWRGRVWPPLNYWVWQGLRRAGHREEARRLAERSFALFSTSWERRLCPENYNGTTGEPLDQPDTDGFYGWGALMPAMAVGEITDVSPWSGWEVTNDGRDLELGPVETPAGSVTATVSVGTLTIWKAGRALLETNIRGRLSELRIEVDRVSFVLAASADSTGFVRLPAIEGNILLARAGGRDLIVRSDAGGVSFTGFDAANETMIVHIVSAGPQRGASPKPARTPA
jgi:putative isomerase